jgi:hypothetical protein
MRELNRGIAVFLILFLVSLSGIAQAVEAAAPAPCDDCKATWGPNVQLTSMLTAGQTFKRMFWGNLTLGEAVNVWAEKVVAVPVDENGVNGIPAQKKKDATDALLAMQELLKKPECVSARNWSMKQLYFWAWNALPVDSNAPAGLKADLLTQLDKLKTAGMMTLTFVPRAQLYADKSADEEKIRKIRKCAKSAVFQSLTIVGIFSVPADPEMFDDEDMEMLAETMKTGLLWDPAQLDAKLVDSKGLMQPMVINMCCDMKSGSRTYRTCIQPPGYLGGSCTMCGAYCCLGSKACP